VFSTFLIKQNKYDTCFARKTLILDKQPNIMQPLILVANDDGITSKGIKALVEVASQLGEVVVVAPDSAQSGMGHAITLDHPLRVYKNPIFGSDVQAYQCNGTPADCVKFGKHFVLKNRKIDLVVSGVNHGSNSSISVIYSGTMSAAIEAAIEGLPAIGFSLAEYGPDANFEKTKPYIKQIIEKVLAQGIPSNVALNVNFPKNSDQNYKGIKICRQALAVYKEEFNERHDPYGRSYYWMDGQLHNPDTNGGTDEDALADNYISIVPCHYDLTHYPTLQQLNAWQF
jgi:5'-nucleotidase